jgi:hypothetical protein
MYFPQKVFYGVFELPLLRNAQKRHEKPQKLKKKKYLPTPFIICQVYVAFHFIFLRRPSISAKTFFGATFGCACGVQLWAGARPAKPGCHSNPGIRAPSRDPGPSS